MRSTRLEGELPSICFDDPSTTQRTSSAPSSTTPSRSRQQDLQDEPVSPGADAAVPPVMFADAIKFCNKHGPQQGKLFIFVEDATKKPEHDDERDWAPDLHDPLPG